VARRLNVRVRRYRRDQGQERWFALAVGMWPVKPMPNVGVPPTRPFAVIPGNRAIRYFATPTVPLLFLYLTAPLPVSLSVRR
jgi:hypothetical protein